MADSAYASFTEQLSQGLAAVTSLPNVVPLALGCLLVLFIGVMIIRRLMRLRRAVRHGYAGSRLQRQVVLTFSLVTIIPTIVISVFSVVFFYVGINDWFNDRITTILNESVAVAEAYIEEHQRTLRADAIAMANDLERDLELAFVNPPRFAEILNGQVALRVLSEAIVLQQNRVLSRSMLSFSLNFESLPERGFETARNGKVAVVERDGRIFAVVAIDPATDTFLVISRLINAKVIEHMEQSKGAAAKYNQILSRIDQFQIIFIIVFILITLSLLLAVVWYGIHFGSRISRPLITLAQATERVRAGDYSIQIEEAAESKEMDMLIRHFNRMTEQLYHQRLELTQVTRMLDQRRRFSETVLSGVSAGVIALDTNLVVNLCNASSLHLLEAVHEHEVTGRSLRTLLPEFSGLLDQVLSRPGDIHEDQITLSRRGKVMTLQVKISAEISQNYVEGFIVTLDDITPLISAQRSAAWSDVARRVAHEIKNPLTPIKLSIDRLRKKFAPEDPESREVFDKYIHTISRHLKDIGTIVEEFSSFARMPTPKMTDIAVKPLLQEALFSAETSHPEIRYTLDMQEENAVIAADEGQLSQLLTNLLKNAAESIQRRSEPEAPAQITLSCYRQDKELVIAISDNGVGFPDDLIHIITEPYVTTRDKGTGLGLAIVKKIVLDHKGSISIDNKPGGGAVVTLAFPLLS